MAEDTLGETLLAFSELPRQNLEKAAGELATTLGDRVAGSYWFDTPGQKAFISALSSVGGLSHVDEVLRIPSAPTIRSALALCIFPFT